MYGRNILSKLVNFFVGLALVFLALRIFFRLFSANPAVGFVDWIYDTSGVLMSPFRGIFPEVVIERGFVLDIPAIFALIMYMVFGLLLASLLNFASGPAVVTKTKR